MVGRIIGHTEPVEADSHLFEDLSKVGMIELGDSAGCGVLGLGSDNDRRSVVVGSADEDDIIPKMPEIADIKVAWNIGPQMAKVAETIGIGKATGDDGRLTGHSD
jgi:hypothetical protein